MDLLNNISNEDYKKHLCQISNLSAIVKKHHKNIDENELYLMMEFLLHGLAEYSLISKEHVEFGLQFKDMISTMFSSHEDQDLDEPDYSY